MAVFTAVFAHGHVVQAADTDHLADGDTITIGSVTYRFEGTLAQINDVKLPAGGDAAADLAAWGHLVKTINGTGVAGTDYFAASTTPHPEVKAVQEALGVKFTARIPGTIGNAIGLSEVIVDAQITVSAATLEGGTGNGETDLLAFLQDILDHHQPNARIIAVIENLQRELA